MSLLVLLKKTLCQFQSHRWRQSSKIDGERSKKPRIILQVSFCKKPMEKHSPLWRQPNRTRQTTKVFYQSLQNVDSSGWNYMHFSAFWMDKQGFRRTRFPRDFSQEKPIKKHWHQKKKLLPRNFESKTIQISSGLKT